MDRVFATAKLGAAYVFRHNFSGNKWENITNRKDGSSVVTFRKRGDKFFIRIAPEGGEKEEYELPHNAQIRDSGEGFVQVPLPEKKQLIGIKFKQKEEGHIFLGKIRAEMDIKTEVTMQAVVLEERTVTMAPNPDKLPKAITGYGHASLPDPSSQHKPPPPVPQENYGNHPATNQPAYPGHPVNQYDGPPAMNQYPAAQPVPNPGSGQPMQINPMQPVINARQPTVNTGQPTFNTGQPAFNPTQSVFNARQPFNSGQPAYNTGQPAGDAYDGSQPVKANRAMPAGAGMAGDQGLVQPPALAPPPQLPPRTDIRTAPKAEPDIPSFTDGEEAKIDHAEFLANAINAGKFEEAHKVINMLQKMAQAKPGKKLSISYTDGPATVPDDVDVTLHLVIEFQNLNKGTLDFYLHFKASMTIAHIQQELELTHHIPKATQNWVIGNQLVKGDMLLKTLRDFGIDGSGTTAKVFIYVMHTKKAQVPKEEYEAIRQCQQEERDRKKRGLNAPWAMSTHHDVMTTGINPPPPTMGTHVGPGQGYSQSAHHPPAMALEPAGQLHQPQPPPPPRREAWGPPAVGEDTYSRTSHNTPLNPAILPPPVRRQADPDPTYAQLGDYQHQPGEHIHRGNYPPPAVRPHFSGHPGPHQQNFPQPPVASHHNFPGGYAPPVDHMPVVRKPPPQPSQPIMAPPQPRPPPVNYPPAPQPHPSPRPPQPQPLQPPQPSKPPPARQIGWSCPQCTFINKPRRPGCEICTCVRPEDYQVPDDVPLDEDEARIMRGLQGSEQMFREYTEAEKRRRERERVENFQALVQVEEEEALVTNDEEFDCPICLVPIDPGEGVRLRGCLHQFCKDCLNQSIMASPDAEVKCPFIDHDYQCNAPLPEREIKQLVNAEQLQQLYKKGLREAESAAGNSYHCKSTNCEGFCFYEDEVNEFNCPICKKVNCLTCKAIHEGINCQEYQDDLRRRAADDEAAKATQEMLDKMVEDGEAMKCPSCEIVVQKKDGCDWIRCSVCKTEICWATKQARWGPKGKGDKSGGCHCRENGRKCHPLCRNCH